jgi:hypothetical protein
MWSTGVQHSRSPAQKKPLAFWLKSFQKNIGMPKASEICSRSSSEIAVGMLLTSNSLPAQLNVSY